MGPFRLQDCVWLLPCLEYLDSNRENSLTHQLHPLNRNVVTKMAPWIRITFNNALALKSGISPEGKQLLFTPAIQ